MSMRVNVGRAGTGRWTVAVLAALSMTLAVAGCGGDQHANASGSGASGTVGIGVLANVTGPTTTGEASAPTVLRAWAGAVNATGGVAGHRIRLSIVDTKGDAPTAATAVQRMARDKSLVAMVLY